MACWMNTSHRPSWPTKSLAPLPTQSSLTSTHAPVTLALCLPPNTSHQSQLPYTTSTLTRPPSPANIKLLPVTTPGPEFASQERPQDTPSGSYKKEPHCNRGEVSNSIEKIWKKILDRNKKNSTATLHTREYQLTRTLTFLPSSHYSSPLLNFKHLSLNKKTQSKILTHRTRAPKGHYPAKKKHQREKIKSSLPPAETRKGKLQKSKGEKQGKKPFV